MTNIESNMLETTHEENQWILIEYAHAIIYPLSLVGILFGLTVLAGYFGSIETLYRPISNGPATNPLTAMCVIFISLALLTNNEKKKDVWLKRVFTFIVILITSARLYDVFTNSNVAALITPFQEQVIHEQQLGISNNMGLNSSFVFLCIAISLSLYSFQRLISSQFIAFIALAIPTTSFTGYLYNLHDFYGEMSILTTIAAFILASASMAMTAHVGSLRAILSPYLGGKIARIQTTLGYVFPILLGYIFIRSFNPNEVTYFAIFVIVISWFIIFMASSSAIFQEKIDNARRKAERRLVQAALVDPLTGLANRRKLFDFGQPEIKRVQRHKNQLWLLILDIDYFKKINDTAGHEMGDKVLIQLGKALQHSVRSTDLVSRIGGEEFSIILVDTNKQGAEQVAESIRMNIENTQIKDWTDIHGAITVSIGCALNDGNYTLEETLKIADRALYQAKENGRNQVVFASDNQYHKEHST